MSGRLGSTTPAAVRGRPTVGADVVLAVEHVSKRFGDVDALTGIDLQVTTGEVLGLLGPNGAGKTTLLRIVSTLLPADAGTVRVCGYDVTDEPESARARLGLAGQFASVDELLTGRENLELIGRLYGIGTSDCRERAGQLLTALALGDAADRRVATYSGGMRRRLDLGATLIGEPSLLLLDEPTVGLDPRSRHELWDLIGEIARRGSGVLLASQNLEEVERLADRVVVLDRGAVIADEAPDALQQRIGGHVIDVRTEDHAALDMVVDTMAAHGVDGTTDPVRRQATGPVEGGLPVASAIAAGVTAAGVQPLEFSLRVPSLEDAFLVLTGDTPGPDAEADAPRAAVGLAEREPPTLTHSTMRDVAVVTGRYWKHLLRNPELLFFATVMPVMFVLGLEAVFGTLVERVVGQDYIQFLLPGVIVMNLALAAGTTGVGMATDLTDGILDRFRSLPMSGMAVLVGRTTTDFLRNGVALAVMIAAGFAIGFQLPGGAVRGLAALGVAMLFGYAATWLFAVIGLTVRDPQAANFLGFAPVLLFVYLSSAWVPVDTMHPAVRGFARHQPVNVTIEAVRALANGTPATSQAVQSILWSLVLTAVFAAIAKRQLGKAVA